MSRMNMTVCPEIPCGRSPERWRGTWNCTNVFHFGNYDILKSHASGQKSPECRPTFSRCEERMPFSTLRSFPITVVCEMERFSFEVNCCTTALEVKWMVEAKTGIAPARQRLHSPIAGHRMFDDCSTLEEEGITVGCNLSVCLKLHGGGDAEKPRRPPADFSRHLSHSSGTCQAPRREEEDITDDEELHDLQGLIRSAIGDKSMQTTCFQILKDMGFDSASSLEGYKVDGLTAVGIRPGHAHSIIREVPNWIRQPVRLCCGEHRQYFLILPVKMSSSLQRLRCKISELYREDFVFICADTEIKKSQENEAISAFYKSKEDTSVPTIDIQFLNGFVPIPLRQRHSTSGSVSSQRSLDRSPLMEATEQDRSELCDSSTTDRRVATVSIGRSASFREANNPTNAEGGELGSTVDTTSRDHPIDENAPRLDNLPSMEQMEPQLGNVPTMEEVEPQPDNVPPMEQVELSITADVAEGSDRIEPMPENDRETERPDAIFSPGPIQGQEDGQEESLEGRESSEFGADSEPNVETRIRVDGLPLGREEPSGSAHVSFSSSDLTGGVRQNLAVADSATSTAVDSAVSRASVTTVPSAASPSYETNASGTTANGDNLELDATATEQAVVVSSGSSITGKKNRRRNRRRTRRSSATVHLITGSEHEDVPLHSSTARSEVSDVGSLHSDSTDIRAAYKDSQREESSEQDMPLLQRADTSSDIPVMPVHVPVGSSCSRRNRFVPTPDSRPLQENAQANENNTPPVAVPDKQCAKRPFGTNPMNLTYPAGSVLPSDASDGVEIEYHSLFGLRLSTLHLSMMKLAVKFIASCLNSRCNGTIGFGINGRRDTVSTVAGHVVGVMVMKNLMTLIEASLRNLLEYHIETEKFSKLGKLQRDSITLHSIRVTSDDSRLSKVGDVFVFEIDVIPQWDILGDHFFYHWWFSSIYDDLLGANAYRVYKNESLVGKDRNNKVLVERLDGATQVRPLTHGTFLREEVQKKHRRYREKMEKEQNEPPSAVVFDEPTLVQLLSERLKALSTSFFNFVLFANDIPVDMRTTRSPFHFNFLKLFPWVAVVDFDQKSEFDGLYRCLTSHVDDGGSALSPTPLHHDDCEKYYTRPSRLMFDKAHVLQAAHQLPWIFANGREGEFERVNDFGTWFVQCQSNIDFALRKIKDQFPHLVAMFLVFGKSSVQEMASLIDSVCCQFKLAQNMTSERRLVILCDEQSTADSLFRSCKVPYVRKHCVAGLPWNVVGRVVTELTGTLPQTDGGKRLLASSGVVTQVPPRKLSEWKTIEVLDYYESKKVVEQHLMADVRDNFYRGEPVSWDNFKLGNDVRRDIAAKVKPCVVERLRARCGRIAGGNPTKVTFSISVVTILHRPGTGGSTLARRILWDVHQEINCRCAVLDGITEKTLQHLEDLQKFGEKNPHNNDCLPLLLCWDGDVRSQFSDLVYQLSKRGVRGVIIEVKALSHQDVDEDEVLGDTTFLVPSKLRDGEVNGFKQIIFQLDQNQETKNRLLENIDRDRRLIYFGLHLFGKNYNQQRLKNYVVDRLDGVSHIEQQMLRFCSFVYIYGHMSMPRSCFKDTYLAGSADEIQRFDIGCLTPSCVDLLLEVQEATDKFYYCGWKPAHQLVAKVILEDQDRVRTSIDFMMTMLRGQSYATKYLAEVACELFSKRVYFQQGDEWYDEYDDIATDFCRDGGRSKRNEQSHLPKPPRSSRYSLFVTEILESPHYGRDVVLTLWFTLCTFVRDNPYAWQHFARFLALTFGGKCVPPLMCYYICELLDRNIGMDDYGTLQLTAVDDVREAFLKCDDEHSERFPNLDGFEIAIRCIHEAHRIEADVSAIYSTEGLIHKTKLEWFSTTLQKPDTGTATEEFVKDVDAALTIAFSAIDAFKKAQSCRQRYRNWYPIVGEIQVCLKMLQIVKDTPFFEKKYIARDGSSFESYISGEVDELPQEMSSLSPKRSEFLKGLTQRILHLLHSVFQHESALHADRSSEEPVQRRWQVAVVAASDLQMQFYSMLALDTDTIYGDKDRWEHNPRMRELLCDSLLKDQKENPYGSWQSLSPRFLKRIIQLLLPVVKERGRKVGCSTVVTLIRACLEIDTDRRPNWSDIVEVVHNCCIDFSQSEWAFMFRGMIHFPMPGGQLANPKLAIDSFRACESIMDKKPFLFKRARPRYFVGRDIKGQQFIISFNRLSSWFGKLEHHRTEGLYLRSQEWWRSHPTWTRLARLQGTRQEGKIINYKGINIRMDQDPYPRSEGRERLWFCVGFTVQGPLAFDPLDEDTYSELCEAEERGEIPTFESIIEARRSAASSDSTEENQRRGVPTGSSGTHGRGRSLARDRSRSRKPQQRTFGNLIPDAASQTTRRQKPPENVRSTSVPSNPHAGDMDGDVKTGESETEQQAAGLAVVTDPTLHSTSVTSPSMSTMASTKRGPVSARSAVTSLTDHVKTPTVAPQVATRKEVEVETKESTLDLGRRNDIGSSSSSLLPAEGAGGYNNEGQSGTDTSIGDGSEYQAVPSSVRSPSNSRREPVVTKSSSRSSYDLSIDGIEGLSDKKMRTVALKFGPFRLNRRKKESAILTFEARKDAETALRTLPTAFEGRKIIVKWAKNPK